MGKVDPPPYNNNFMGEHYSSRVNRYTPVNSNLYSNNMLIKSNIEHNKCIINLQLYHMNKNITKALASILINGAINHNQTAQ